MQRLPLEFFILSSSAIATAYDICWAFLQEIISWSRAYIFHFSLGRVFHFPHQPGVKHLLTHTLWEEGQASYIDSHRLSCQETAELWRVLDQFPELFHAGLDRLKGTKCEADLVNQKPV